MVLRVNQYFGVAFSLPMLLFLYSKESAYNELSLLLLCSYTSLFLQGALDTLLNVNQTFCDLCEVKVSPKSRTSLSEENIKDIAITETFHGVFDLLQYFQECYHA